jgi:hypothetical protein
MRATDWARALIAGVLPAAVAYAFAATSTVPWWPVLLVPIGAWVARPKARSGRGTWVLATLLAAVAVLAATRGRNFADAGLGTDAWPTYDLATTPMPTTPPLYVGVTGVLRDGFILGEYAVAQGDVPDQSRPADAVLVPMTPTNDAAVQLTGALVVVRIRADVPRTQERVTLFGRTEILPREIVVTLVDLAGADADGAVGILVDTLRVPQPGEVWTAIALLVALAGGAAVAFAIGRREAAQG